MANITLVKIYLLCIIFILGLTAIGLGALVGIVPELGDAIAGLADTVSEAIEIASVVILGFIKFREKKGEKSAPTSTMILICAYIVMSLLQVSSNLVGALPIAGDVAAPIIKVILQMGQFVDAVILAF